MACDDDRNCLTYRSWRPSGILAPYGIAAGLLGFAVLLTVLSVADPGGATDLVARPCLD